jgi:hypothetical protein
MSPTIAQTSTAPAIPELSRERIMGSYWYDGFVALLVFVLLLLNIWDKLRAKPPLHEQFVSKPIFQQELAAMRTFVVGEVGSLMRNLERVERRIESETKEMEQRVLAQIADNRSSSDRSMGSLNGKMEAMQTSFQSFTNDMFRALGTLEGTTGGKAKG